MRVVAVDDEKYILEELVDLLSDALPEAEIVKFNRPTEVWEWLQNNSCDYVFTDRSMPGMSGSELGDKIGEKYPEIEVFMMSAEPASTMRREGVPIERCIFKPYSKESILEKVNSETKLPPFRVQKKEEVKVEVKEEEPAKKSGFFAKLFK